MENKYYTPEIEEFHVGFEYESEEDPRIPTWEKQKVETYRDLANCMEYYGNDADVETRVKHLDREDIESLGFILNVVDCGEDTQYNELGIRRNKEGGYFGTFFLDDTHGEYNIQIFESFYRIKNKSELKRLLKQLGI
jgi:hypothetical protein